MPIPLPPPYQGACPCRATAYTIHAPPLVINSCHCTNCQSQTGTAFATNLIIESAHITLSPTTSPLLKHDMPTASGLGQVIVRCSKCYYVLWSHYGSPVLSMVRVGTLEERVKKVVRPDAHIFIGSRLPWVVLEEGIPKFEGYYNEKEVWPEDAMWRREVFLPEAKKWMEERSEKIAGVGAAAE